jgi:site-specific DNA recombinase
MNPIDPTLRAALYARVSSEQQAQAGTIDSQVAAIRGRAGQDGLTIETDLCFIDDGVSGATLVRPALERLRDQADAGEIDRLYMLCPDRLSRSYAYQVLLVDELRRCGVELVFVNRDLAQTPEDQLLLQVQGMVAEYERAKIIERCRRGKLHAARRGSVNVLGGAPYGYRYVAASDVAAAQYNVHMQEVEVVQQMFQWIGVERWSIGQVCRRLKTQGIPSPRGKGYWDRSTVWGILNNPAYKGEAAFGKTRLGPARPRLRGGRNRHEQARDGQSCYDAPLQEWITIPVPAIVEEELFDAVAAQLEENRRRNREGRRGARYLLQGLLVCTCCQYAYYGKQISLSSGKGKRRSYGYYRCVGTDAYRFGGQRVCKNKQVRQDLLDQAVWNDVQALLADPKRIERELERRNSPDPKETDTLQKMSMQIQKMERGVARLIDAYGEGLLDKGEFEPRIKSARERLSKTREELKSRFDRQSQARELRLVMDNLATFSRQVSAGLEQADWAARREIIRTLVKRVEIDHEEVKVVYRVDLSPFDHRPSGPSRHAGTERGESSESPVLHYCRRRDQPAVIERVYATFRVWVEETGLHGPTQSPYRQLRR